MSQIITHVGNTPAMSRKPCQFTGGETFPTIPPIGRRTGFTPFLPQSHGEHREGIRNLASGSQTAQTEEKQGKSVTLLRCIKVYYYTGLPRQILGC